MMEVLANSDISKKTRGLVQQRSNGQCEATLPRYEQVSRKLYVRRCLNRASEIHHVRFRSRGGTGGEENLVHLCKACHSRAGDSADVWFARYRSHRWQQEGKTELDRQNLVSNMVLSIPDFEYKVWNVMEKHDDRWPIFLCVCGHCGMVELMTAMKARESCKDCAFTVLALDVTALVKVYKEGMDEIKKEYKM